MAYVQDSTVHEMAAEALTSYEMTAEWSSAVDAAREYCLTEYGIRPSATCVGLAIKLAKMGWSEITIATKQEVEA